MTQPQKVRRGHRNPITPLRFTTPVSVSVVSLMRSVLMGINMCPMQLLSSCVQLYALEALMAGVTTVIQEKRLALAYAAQRSYA